VRLVPSAVLDASALLAYLQGENGAEQVSAALTHGTVISAVNWAEVLSKLADKGKPPEAVSDQLTQLGLLGQAIQIYPLDAGLCEEIAKLSPLTRSAGLSLGDRACLALASHLKLPALTADQIWKTLNVGVSVHLIR
jgi:ribonuclease VapC